jgi:hypothetical protein
VSLPLSPAILRLLSRNPALEGAFVPPLARPRLAFSLYPSGLLRGGLTHLDGPANTEALLRLLSEQTGLQAAWVEARLTAYPPGFVQRGVNLACLLFVEAEEQFPWALTELVRSQVFGVVAVASPLPDAMALRRLQLAAERAACAVLLVASLPESAWPVRARLWCDREDGELKVKELGPAHAEDTAEAGGLP